jgi:hypothetical protein
MLCMLYDVGQRFNTTINRVLRSVSPDSAVYGTLPAVGTRVFYANGQKDEQKRTHFQL